MEHSETQNNNFADRIYSNYCLGELALWTGDGTNAVIYRDGVRGPSVPLAS